MNLEDKIIKYKNKNLLLIMGTYLCNSRKYLELIDGYNEEHYCMITENLPNIGLSIDEIILNNDVEIGLIKVLKEKGIIVNKSFEQIKYDGEIYQKARINNEKVNLYKVNF